MDMGGKDKFETEKGNEDSINYHSLNMSSDWRFGNTNFMNSSSMELISTEIPMAVCKGDLIESSSCSSASMVDSFCPPIWDHHSNSPNMAFSDLITQNNAIATTSSSYPIMGVRKGGLGTVRTGNERAIDMGGWTQPNSMLRGGVYLPVSPGMIPQSLSQFPADSGFIERAARFSCFGGGNFGDVMSPFSFTPMQGSQEGILGSVMKAISGGPSDRNEVIHMVEASKDVSPTELSPLKNESFVRSHDEAKQGLGVSGNESDEAEYSGGDGQEEPSGPEGAGGEPSFSKGLGSKKRKRSGQDTELDQAKRGPQPSDEVTNNNTELEQKGDQNPASAGDKPSGKHGKQQGSQASDAQKDEYIHIRARRGQATNSHSLAERVRREKISERMKFLQDLVPGCSKVTGKAVMLDEIINYVQSLQRQVEFLSMKLATVNPRMDFNVDGLVAKDILSRAGPSSTLGFSHDMTMAFSSLHPSQSGLIQTGLTGMANSSDALRRTINSQLMAMSGGFKDPTPQVPNSWEDELNNVVQMGFNASAPLTSQDLSGSLPAGQMKVEL